MDCYYKALLKSPTSSSLLCYKHFEPDCYDIEGKNYCNQMGFPMKKPDVILTIFPKRPTHETIYNSSTPPPRPAAKKHRW